MVAVLHLSPLIAYKAIMKISVNFVEFSLVHRSDNQFGLCMK